MESGRWETHRGDEWWFLSHFIEANAGFNHVPQALVIGELRVRGSGLTTSRLHSFLWQTKQQLKDAQIWLFLNSTVRPLIEELGTDGKIRWEIIRNPLSEEARVTHVSDPG